MRESREERRAASEERGAEAKLKSATTKEGPRPGNANPETRRPACRSCTEDWKSQRPMSAAAPPLNSIAKCRPRNDPEASNRRVGKAGRTSSGVESIAHAVPRHRRRSHGHHRVEPGALTRLSGVTFSASSFHMERIKPANLPRKSPASPGAEILTRGPKGAGPQDRAARISRTGGSQTPPAKTVRRRVGPYRANR